MCGIAGIFDFNNNPVEQKQLSAMTNCMIERGPDDDGFYLSGNVGLGFRRLSIIDVTGGHQPISNENNTLQLIFNGEIYNHIELRSKLIAQGHVFQTQSDAEVLLHLYEEKGFSALDDLNGMFAFALFDTQRNGIWIGRDRIGIKPLFYAEDEGRLIFASDTRSVRAVFNTSIDRNSVFKYIALAYVPDTETMWQGIKKLPPAHYLWVESNGSIALERYWSINSIGMWSGSLLKAKKELDLILADSIKLQMRSDVPVGIFLSGGVDSSGIVAYASKLTEQPLRTFNINFEDKNSSDSSFAQAVAKQYGTNHTEINVDAAETLGALDELLHLMDEPISDSAIFPAYILSKVAREQGIKVMLNGAGGDEIFGGYSRHSRPRFASPSWVSERGVGFVNRGIAKIWSLLQPHRGMRALDPAYAWAAGVSGVNLSACRRLLRDPESYNKISNAILSEYSDLNGEANTSNYSYNRMLLDFRTYLVNDVLSLTDKATMAASIECRVPLLDHRLVEFSYSLPSRINLLNGLPKGLFKEVLKDYLPKGLLHRKKDGFNAPIHEWMQQEGTLNLVDELLYNKSALLDDIIDFNELRKMLSNKKQNNHTSETLFSLFLLNKWCQAQSL